MLCTRSLPQVQRKYQRKHRFLVFSIVACCCTKYAIINISLVTKCTKDRYVSSVGWLGDVAFIKEPPLCASLCRAFHKQETGPGSHPPVYVSVALVISDLSTFLKQVSLQQAWCVHYYNPLVLIPTPVFWMLFWSIPLRISWFMTPLLFWSKFHCNMYDV